MTYIPGQESPDGMAKVVYEGKTSGVDETFTALDWAGRRQACCSPMHPGWPGLWHISRAKASKWYGIMVITPTNPEE